MIEVDIENIRYQCHKLPTRVQFHVAKRLMPAATIFMPLIAASQEGQQVAPDAWVAGLQAAAGLISDQDLDYVVDRCLAAVKFQSGSGWANLTAPNGGIMFEPADEMDIQLRLVWEVMRTSLANFSFERLLQSQAGPNGAMIGMAA
jgi:hypothetical protein